MQSKSLDDHEINSGIAVPFLKATVVLVVPKSTA